MRDVHGLSFRISVGRPELGSKAVALNSLVLQRWQFNKLATQATNRLHQFLIAVFPEAEACNFRQLARIVTRYPTPKDILNSNSLQTIERLRKRDKENILRLATNTVGIPGDIYQWLIKDLGIQRMEALAKRDVITKVIRTQVAAHPYGHILLSFPCLGEIAAATIIGIIKDIERWPSKKKFKKALGVYNSMTQSGNGLIRNRQGKEGSKHGRRVLFQVCLCCIRKNTPENDFKDYYIHQVVQGKVRIKAVVSTMGKLAEIIYHCLKFREPYQYQGKCRIPTINTVI